MTKFSFIILKDVTNPFPRLCGIDTVGADIGQLCFKAAKFIDAVGIGILPSFGKVFPAPVDFALQKRNAFLPIQRLQLWTA